MEIRKRKGMLERSCPNKKTITPECWFDSSLAYICKTKCGNQFNERTMVTQLCNQSELHKNREESGITEITIISPYNHLRKFTRQLSSTLKLARGMEKQLALLFTLISFISVGTPAILRSAVNDTNTNIAATLVCNIIRI